MKKISIPAAIVVLAITGAFASQTKSTKVVTTETGWIDTPAPCQVDVQCSTVDGPVCTMFYQGAEQQAYGKNNPSDLTCAKILHRLQ